MISGLEYSCGIKSWLILVRKIKNKRRFKLFDTDLSPISSKVKEGVEDRGDFIYRTRWVGRVNFSS